MVACLLGFVVAIYKVGFDSRMLWITIADGIGRIFSIWVLGSV